MLSPPHDPPLGDRSMASRLWRIRWHLREAPAPVPTALSRGLRWLVEKLGFRLHESKPQNNPGFTLSSQAQSRPHGEQYFDANGEHLILEQDISPSASSSLTSRSGLSSPSTSPSSFENEKALVDTFVLRLNA